MSLTATRTLSAILAALTLVPALADCSPAKDPSALTAEDFEPLTPDLADIFDNGLDSAVVGIRAPLTASDRETLTARAQQAEFIVRGRIETVTVRGSGESAPYNITIRILGEPLGAARAPGDSFSLVIDASNPSYQLVAARDLALVGTPVIALLRRFALQDAVDLRWHLAADTPEVQRAVHDALLVSSVRSK